MSFALIHAEKLTLRMRYGLCSSKYKRPEFGRLQDIIDAKRQASNKTVQTVIIFFPNIMPVPKTAIL